MKKHILIIEDDSHIRLGLREALAAEGFEVSETGDGHQAVPLARQLHPHLILLDIMLPGKNGYDICRELRAHDHTTPIIMLTAKGQEVDRVVGLELGADDYVCKPFGIRELIARVHAILRRTQAPVANSPALPDSLTLGNVSIRPAALQGTKDGEPFELTDREMKVLGILFEKKGDVVSREDLLNRVWGVDYYGTTRTVDQVIVKLRQKLEPNPAEPKHLLTVHGVGYRLVP